MITCLLQKKENDIAEDISNDDNINDYKEKALFIIHKHIGYRIMDEQKNKTYLIQEIKF